MSPDNSEPICSTCGKVHRIRCGVYYRSHAEWEAARRKRIEGQQASPKMKKAIAQLAAAARTAAADLKDEPCAECGRTHRIGPWPVSHARWLAHCDSVAGVATGWTHSAAAKRRISEANRGRYTTPEHVEAIQNSLRRRRENGDVTPHGTNAKYASGGCRCDECRTARRDYLHGLAERTRSAAGA